MATLLDGLNANTLSVRANSEAKWESALLYSKKEDTVVISSIYACSLDISHLPLGSNKTSKEMKQSPRCRTRCASQLFELILSSNSFLRYL